MKSKTTNVWAATWQNQQNDLCAHRRLRSAWASAKSGQSSQCAQWVAEDPVIRHVDNEDSELSLRWAQRSFCWFCHEAAHLWFPFLFPVLSYRGQIPDMLEPGGLATSLLWVVLFWRLLLYLALAQKCQVSRHSNAHAKAISIKCLMLQSLRIWINNLMFTFTRTKTRYSNVLPRSTLPTATGQKRKEKEALRCPFKTAGTILTPNNFRRWVSSHTNNQRLIDWIEASHYVLLLKA